MIIYALIIIAILFFLSWNLISDRKSFVVATVITTGLFLITVFFAVANFSYHYGMHQVAEPRRVRRIESLSPVKSLKILTYRQMGSDRNSQMVIYKNGHQKLVHTAPDIKVRNRIIRSSKITRAHVVTKATKWRYRNSWDRTWFNLAEKPRVDHVSHVFYVPKSWTILSAKQTIAFKQIVKNRSLQLKRQMGTPQAKLKTKQLAAGYVKAKVARAVQRNPELSSRNRNRVMKNAAREFKSRSRQKAEDKLTTEALRTAETIN